jgi:isopentenyl diphosphate isomerase/L-lactate dehydrogenase-like FMN-dependent dehydrogenase
MAVANGPSIPHARIAASAAGPRFNQFYPVPDPELSRDTLLEFVDLGTKAIIITVDNTANVFERDLHNRNLGGMVRTPGRGRGAGAAVDPEAPAPARGRGTARGTSPARLVNPATPNPATPTFPDTSKYRVSNRRLWYNWRYIDELRNTIKLPMLIKGILSPEDAELCIQHGADGIIVSNHGGRSMDYGPSTLEVLPDIVAVVRGRVPVIVDSGFRRGSDVFKALALGANAVELGRAARWGLGAFGAAGTQRLLEIVQAELTLAAAIAGRPTLSAIDKTAVKVNFV